MGLLEKAINNKTETDAVPGDIKTIISDFQQINPFFHCVVLRFNEGREQGLNCIAEITAFHGVVCLGLPGENGLVLLPGRLDMELFSHQLSESTGSTVLFQFSVNSPSLALESLSPYLQ